MRLPLPVYKLVNQYMGHHGCWHRLRDPSFTQQQRDACFPPGELFPHGLRDWTQQGSGVDFLRFHRMMIRNFKWILQQISPCSYAYHPWKELPQWLAPLLDAMDPVYRDKLFLELSDMVNKSTLDDLGRFIEGPEANDDFPQVHWLVHDLTAKYESIVFSPQPRANMADMATACFNEHFWGFHGWIDHWYAQWQKNHGEEVDQSPTKPDHYPMCEYCREMKSEVSLLGHWDKYVKLRSQLPTR